MSDIQQIIFVTVAEAVLILIYIAHRTDLILEALK